MTRTIRYDVRSQLWHEWQKAYETAVERSFFLSPRWGRAVVAEYGFKPWVKVFDYSEQRLVLPCFVTRNIRGMLHGVRSTAPYHYGGFLSDKPLLPEVMERVARDINRQWLLHTLIIAASPRGGIIGWDKYQLNTFTSQILDLSGGYAYVWGKSFDDKQRNIIRKAQRSGVVVRKDNSPQSIESYYALYLSAANRWHLSLLESRRFFQTLLADAPADVTLWLASKNDQDIAGIIVANNARDTAYYLAAASNSDFWEYGPNNLLLATAIEEACDRGFTQFDLLPSGRIASVERFKASFGATKIVVPEYWLQGYLPTLKSRLTQTIRSIHAQA